MAPRLSRGFVAAALLLAGCSGGSRSAAPARGGDSIVFSTRVGIYVVRADGTGLRQVTAYDGNYPPLPAWSPDGTQIAFDQFVGRCECRIDLYVIRLDGTGQRRLTRGGLNSAPAWSPDGKLIAYEGTSAIWVVSPDGTGRRRLTPARFREPHGGPAWSPDGRKIAFRTLDDSIFVLTLDGGRVRRLVRHGGIPVWSTDGKHIAFDRATPSACRCRSDIYAVAADGNRLRRLSHARYRSFEPAWSRDGRIVFVGSGLTRSAIYVMAADGSRVRRLTPYWETLGEPVWSPDGRRIAFIGARSCLTNGCEEQSIYVIDANGRGLRRVTREVNPDSGTGIAWQPAGAARP